MLTSRGTRSTHWKVSAGLTAGSTAYLTSGGSRLAVYAERNWLVERYVEVYPEGEDERTTATFEPLTIGDAHTLAESLPDLARQLLAIPRPSVRPTAPQAS